MAKNYGQAGRNATDESIKRFKRFALVAILAVVLVAWVSGYAVGTGFPIKQIHWSVSIVSTILCFIVLFSTWRWASKRLEQFDRERVAWRKGAVGEVLVAGILEDLPDEFMVINDVSKRFGNIDHVVIGPTGVYVVDTKNWKGSIKADGNGELLVNGKSPQKPAIKNMLGAVMDFQNKLKALAEQDYFVRGLMVFPNAYVEANFGSTRHIHCLRDERLLEYIKDATFAHRLSNDDIGRAKRATLQMAGMDTGFH